MRIAHLSDPHINQRYHPQHLPRLRRVLEHALTVQRVDHIAITGDITSNCDIRDLKAVRQLFESLGVLNSSKLSLVVGNHDIFGGPHLADELLNFPDHCKHSDYAEKLAIFQETFAELFTGVLQEDGSAYPYLKRVRNVCFMGLNTVAKHSLLENPVGSNGKITKDSKRSLHTLAKHHAWESATHRIVLMHHHMFRKRDIQHLRIADAATGNGILAMIEQGTLKLHGKRHVLRLFEEIGADMILHGHVHFTGEYNRHEILCLNSAGAVFPVSKVAGFHYHVIDFKPMKRAIETVRLPRRGVEEGETATRTLPESNNGVIHNL